MRDDVLKMLCDAEGYISGEDMSDILGISRAAVWKNIKNFKEDGGLIEAKNNAGYKLISLPDLLKPEYVGLYLDGVENKIVWLDNVDSTNNYAKTLARDGASSGTVVVAEHQTGGKGRLGRGWSSAPHNAVMMSIVARPDIQPASAPAFNFAVALGVTKAVEDECGIGAAIKWPNDVVFEGKKLCGILTEMSCDMDKVEYLVCGVGINVNQESFPDEISDKATSLRIIKGEKVDRVRICASLIKWINVYFDVLETQGTDGIMDEYCKKSIVVGKDVRIQGAQGQVLGKCVGFGAVGQILVDTGSESMEFHAGDVSLRGVDDYV